MNQDINTRNEIATLAMAASIVDRAYDLIQDGWVQGRLYTSVEGSNATKEYCIHGAINLAIEEMFGNGQSVGRTHVDGTRMLNRPASDINDVAVAFIIDEAVTHYNYKGGGTFLGAAGFNDAPNRKLDDVLKVLSGASKRLWDLSLLNEASEDHFEFSKWADNEIVDDQVALNYLYATIS